MAVPELRNWISTQTGKSSVPPLFKRLPEKLFSPLGSANRERYWGLLCRLHADRFGPDAPLPPSQGYLKTDIIRDIERELSDENAWDIEDDETPDTPFDIRAVGIFNRLQESGWFRPERHGMEKTVSMSPGVSHFLTMLVSFAESGPIYLSGKINSIDANLKMIADGSASGDTLAEAAQQARNLLEHVRNTSTIIRDLMESLNKDITPAQYVQRFFTDYIERVFIGDYRELHTREHPLAKRQQIIRTVENIDASLTERTRLINWYEQKRFNGDTKRAERQYDRDIQRLLELQKIDGYLDRLDDEIRRANKKALNYLDYRLRSLRPVDHLVKLAIHALLADASDKLSDPFAPGEMVNSAKLAEPRKVIERSEPSALRRSIPTEGELARARVMLRARDARNMTPPKLYEFVRRQLEDRMEMPASQAQLDSVVDVRAYQTLSTLALAMSSQSKRLQLATKVMARGFTVMPDGGEEIEHPFISGKSFSIELLVPARKNTKENA